jgi:hypothetical protein
MYTDLTSAVSGSAMADGMDAGLLKTVLGVLFKRKKTPKKNPFFCGPHLFLTALARILAILALEAHKSPLSPFG